MITLVEYAERKHLDIDRLHKWGVRDGLIIPYGNEDSEVVATRLRRSWGEFRWLPGYEEIVPYGLWKHGLWKRWQSSRIIRDLYLAEGESDAHTLWHHHIPALGIPGASMWRDEWRQYTGNHRRVAIREPGDGGSLFVRELAKSFGGIFYATMEPYKDVSEAHIALGEEFPDFFCERVEQARYWDVAPSPKRGPRGQGDGSFGPELLKLAEQHMVGKELKEHGAGDFWGCCPFHEENTPSFHLNAITGVWKCFGCGKAGGLREFRERVKA